MDLILKLKVPSPLTVFLVTRMVPCFGFALTLVMVQVVICLPTTTMASSLPLSQPDFSVSMAQPLGNSSFTEYVPGDKLCCLLDPLPFLVVMLKLV